MADKDFPAERHPHLNKMRERARRIKRMERLEAMAREEAIKERRAAYELLHGKVDEPEGS